MSNKPSPFSNAQLSWNNDEHGVLRPYSVLYDDIYYSSTDPIGESKHVFLEANQLKQRWLSNNNDPTQGANTFVIAECGFGSGLNFLNTCELWCECIDAAAPPQRLHYIACEMHPLLTVDLIRIHQAWPHLFEFSQALQQQYIDHTPGCHRLIFSFANTSITLDLLYGDAKDTLEDTFKAFSPGVDAWFLDGFSPKLNPRMWNKALFLAIAKLSKANTTLSSYSVAGDVRRGLIDVGFTVTKSKGFGKKRHMISAFMSDQSNPQKVNQTAPASSILDRSWLTLPSTANPPRQSKRVAIIGAGLAGCATALAMAKRGWEVTIIEQHARVATMASGNSQGIVQCKISRNLNPPAQFMLQAYLFALRHYRALATTFDFQWQQCGLLQLADNESSLKRQQQIDHLSMYSSKIMRPSSAQQNSQLANYHIDLPGVFFPDSAWLNPEQLCQAYCHHPNIRIQLNTKAIKLTKNETQWKVVTENMPLDQATSTLNTEQRHNDEITADAIIIANSLDAEHLQQSRHYPLIANRGQIDLYQTNERVQKINTIVCGKGYVLPSINGHLSIGGCYTANTKDIANSKLDSEHNLHLINSFLPLLHKELEGLNPIKSRTALRSSTPDYLPIIGAVEDYKACREIYAELALNAKSIVSQTPKLESGLYVNLAHGSHGLTSTPLAAEYLASIIEKEISPLPNSVMTCLHPLRFLMRDLKKQKI